MLHLRPSVGFSLLALVLQGVAPCAAAAPESLTERLVASARSYAEQLGASASAAAGGGRVEVDIGSLDPQWQLAPCERIEAYLPSGLPGWGRTRVGLRCMQGAKPWNVSLPVTLHLYRESLVASAALPAGSVLAAAQFQRAAVDVMAAPGAPFTEAEAVQGRVLARNLTAGTALRSTDLKPRLWFAAGERVRVLAGGPGWQIATEGEALSAGVEGQAVRVRAESGKLLQGRAVATRTVEIGL